MHRAFFDIGPEYLTQVTVHFKAGRALLSQDDCLLEICPRDWKQVGERQLGLWNELLRQLTRVEVNGTF